MQRTSAAAQDSSHVFRFDKSRESLAASAIVSDTWTGCSCFAMMASPNVDVKAACLTQAYTGGSQMHASNFYCRSLVENRAAMAMINQSA